ncbi:MAG TPA: ribonuclease Z [Myxococcota bacterium]|nr:ribonuclease Z [Myxococcota bacterium]
MRPDPERMGPSILLSQAGTNILLDCGPCSLRSLAQAGHDTAAIDGVCLTHRHTDHVSEFGLLLDLEKNRSRKRPLAVAGPAIVDELIAFHLAWGRDEPADLGFALTRLLMPGRGRIGPFQVRGESVPHVTHSVGYRVEAAGKSLVYPGDCGPGDEVVYLAERANLLVLEASLPCGSGSAAHLSPEDAAAIAKAARCDKLVLTHFPPGADIEAALATCRRQGIDTQAARDLAEIEI